MKPRQLVKPGPGAVPLHGARGGESDLLLPTSVPGATRRFREAERSAAWHCAITSSETGDVLIEALVEGFNKAIQDADHVNENEMKSTAFNMFPGMNI